MKGRKWLRRLSAERVLHPNIGRGHIQLKRRRNGLAEGDLDPLLPAQVFDKRGYRRPSSGEERMAWRLLERCVLDACQGPKRARLKYITEMQLWEAAKGPEGDDYTFSHWCACLGVDEGHMRSKFRAWLLEQKENAEAGKRGDFKILRQIEAVRIEQPHTLFKCVGAPFNGKCEHDEVRPHYICLSCRQRGLWDDFLAYTCVRGQEQPAEGLKRLPDLADYVEKVLNEKSNSKPLNASDSLPMRHQGCSSDHELDNWVGEGGRPDDGGAGSAFGVGAMAARPAAGGGAADV